ncbi:MAG: glycosyltransferase family 2 protein [Verrucomicrobiia bacterium]
MYQNLRIAIVIPAYREEERIEDVIRGLPSWVDHIVVVDDASPDATLDRARSVGDQRLVVLRHDHNQGVGGAALTGFAKALELGADVLVKMDGDGQMNPAGLPALIEPIRLGEADYVKGNRFLHSRELVRMPWVRRLGNIGLSFMAKMASGYWNLFDPNNGYVAIHAAVLPLLDQNRIHKRFFFENSMLLELGLNRAVVRDVYMPARYNEKVSHLSETRTLLEFPPLLLRGLVGRVVMQYFVRDFNAVSLFIVTGLAATIFGILWGGYYWWWYAHAGLPTPTGTVMIAVLPVILGLQLLLQALVMDVQNVPRESVQSTIRKSMP